MNQHPSELPQRPERKARIGDFAFLAPLLAAFPLAFLYLMVIGAYWEHYDMGSPAPNSLVLVFLYGPVVLVLLLSVTILGWPLLRRLGVVKPWLRVMFLFIAMLLVFVGGVAYEVHRLVDYPKSVDTTFVEFLKYFLRSRFHLG